ncbi:MAG: methyltransferase domain-containing protein [Verrucomicrobiota bacterium JB025]|nr:class I SAM-dependent methyltransferase [Verrucomicrobiota bacterium JB025]
MKVTKLANYEDPNSFGSRMRAKRLAPLVDLIKKVHAAKGGVRILDVGGRETYWKALDAEFLKQHNVTVTIMNLPCELVGEESPTFKYAPGDACNMPEYEDGSFDIVHSNSVIEHVGNWDKVKAFAREVQRVAPNLFVQTPSYWFPIEPHFIKPFHHWLPKPVRVWIWMHFGMGQRKKAENIDEAMTQFDDEPYLLNMEMFEYLFPSCRILRERFLFFTKSMVAYRSE